MQTLNAICDPFGSTRPRSCCCAHRPAYRRTCCSSSSSFFLSIEEILSWIVISSLILLLYNTIKLCFTIALMSFLIYWFYQHVPIRRWLEKLSESINDSDLSLIETMQSIVQRFVRRRNPKMVPSTDRLVVEKSSDPVQEDSTVDRTTESSSSNMRHSSSISQTSVVADVHHDQKISIPLQETYPRDHTMNKSRSNQKMAPSSSKTKHRLIETDSKLTEKLESHQPPLNDGNHADARNRTGRLFNYTSSISQPGRITLSYHGPIHTVTSQSQDLPDFKGRSIFDQPRSSMDIITEFAERHRYESSTSKLSSQMPQVDDPTISDVLEQTKDIRKAIANLHDDVVRIRADLDEQKRDCGTQLSPEETAILKFAAENLIEAIRSSKMDGIPSRSKQYQNPSATQANSDIEAMTNDGSVPHKTRSLSDLQTPPPCLPVQPSMVVNTTLPRVPSKATVIAINDVDDQEVPYEEEMSSHQHIVISADQFENIPSRSGIRFHEKVLMLPDSSLYQSDRKNWIDFTPKSDPFPNAIQSDLPIPYSDDEQSSLKQSLLSYFHRRPKLVNNHYPSIPITPMIETHELTKTKSLQQLDKNNNDCIDRFSLRKQLSLHHLKEQRRIFRVRKSRILVSFDDIQRAIEVDHPSEPRFNTILRNVATAQCCTHPQINIDPFLSSPLNNNQHRKETSKESIVSVLNSFNGTMEQNEFLLKNDEITIFLAPGDTDEDDHLLSIRQHSLYSVVSHLI